MYKVDYFQAVTPELDERLDGLEELKGVIEYAMNCFDDLPQRIKEDYITLMGDLETQLECVEDEIGEVERQIDAEINGVDGGWSD